ncbi:MAG: hypothetical protein ACO1N9_05500 [Flavobacterium sp.]
MERAVTLSFSKRIPSEAYAISIFHVEIKERLKHREKESDPEVSGEASERLGSRRPKSDVDFK